MSTLSKFRGHTIEFINNKWVFEDTKLPISESHLICKCKYCNEEPTTEGHDACLGTLEGVSNGCCGHGIPEDAYVQFSNGETYYGCKAVEIQNMLKRKDV